METEVGHLLEEAVERLRPTRRTFTEDEALSAVWELGIELPIHVDSRFVLARERDAKHPRQWRLAEQVLGNDRLLDALNQGTWDGRDVDAKLAELEAEDGVHYVFCPVDPRFQMDRNGTLRSADREVEVELAPEERSRLDELAAELTTLWLEEGAQPLTVRQISGMLESLGWDGGNDEDWRLVQAWLASWDGIRRVGYDYWALAHTVPEHARPSRFRVLAIGRDSQDVEVVYVEQPEPPVARIETEGPNAKQVAAWTVPLRTTHINEGVLRVPKAVRSIYPSRRPGEGDVTALRGRWYADNDRLWVWLDRSANLLYGADLADKLAWCEAGDLLRVQWAPDVLVFSIIGRDEAVQEEETRLVDVEVLAELRGGLGESYRQSIQAILSGAPDGLTFREVVESVRERQGHTVHRGSIRSALYAGGFVHGDGRWYSSPDPEGGRRRLRRVIRRAEVESAPDLATTSASVRQRLQELLRRLEAGGPR